MSSRVFGIASLVVAASVAAIPATGASGAKTETRSVVDVEALGSVALPTGTLFGGTEIGGLSSISYDSARGVYYALSDDQGNRATGDPVRYYTLAIDLGDGTLGNGDLEFLAFTQLFDAGAQPYAPGGLDPEGLALGRPGQLYVSSEGNVLVSPAIDPFIRRYDRTGQVTAELPIPEHYLSTATTGVRFNLSFESLNVTPSGRKLVTAGEGALVQDGPASTFTNGSLARLLVYDVAHRSPEAEYVYEVGPWSEPSPIFGVNGIVEVLPIDDVGTMLVMERSFSVGGVGGGGTGNVVVINEVSTVGATNVLDVDALYSGGSPIPLDPVTQREVFAFDDLGVPIDNLEGMTFGPPLADGRQTLVVVSDNNFSAGQFTQFLVLALDIRPVS